MREKLNKNKKIILTVIAVLILCVGSTLAYIIAQLQDEARGNASVTSDAVDILKFDVDKDINLNPTQFNVTEGGDNLQDSAVGSAILRANSTDNNATYNYYVYFQINSNNYIYTTPEQTPEIVLTITDPEGNPVTSISGLDYVTSGGVSGFDITTKSGLYEVAELYEIVSTSSTDDTIQEWEFIVSFINLDTNQAENGGKTLEAEIILSRNPLLSSYLLSLYTEDGVNDLYYHDGQGTYINAELELGDYSYRYSGSDYQIASTYQGIYNSINDLIYFGNQYNGMSYKYGGLELGQAVARDYCEINDLSSCDYEDVFSNQEFGEYIDSLYANGTITTGFILDYNNKLFFVEDIGYLSSYNLALEKAINDGYVTQNNINNYVCFGSTESVCPEENMYRIIGVFNNEIKLIKSNSIGEYPWRVDELASDAYDWGASDMVDTLNITYLNNFSSEWSDLIAPHNWKVGKLNIDDFYTVNPLRVTFDYELGAFSSGETYSSKIGLMYLSDYLYSADSSNWDTNPESFGKDLLPAIYSSKKTNPYDSWLFLAFAEWTITVGRGYDGVLRQFCNFVDGGFGLGFSSESLGVRPVFYLKSNVQYASGDGSIDNPYRIEI